jgi:hypothetical protein
MSVMFKRLCETLKARPKGLRQSRRAGKNQRGGAEWHTTTSKYFKEASYKTKWQNYLKEAIPAVSVTAIIACLESNKNVDQWLTLSKYQDAVMQTGLRIIMEDITGKVGSIDKDDVYQEIVKKVGNLNDADTKTDLDSLRDVFANLETFISLGHGTKFTGDKKAPTNKFEFMFKQRDGVQQELAELLLHPKRIENMLVQSVAQIIVMLTKANLDEIKTKLAADPHQILFNSLVNKWTFFSINFVQNETNMEVRDSWVLGEEPKKTADIKTFWTDFLTESLKDEYKYAEGDDYGILAAKFMKAKLDGKDLLTFIKADAATAPSHTYTVDALPPQPNIKDSIFENLEPFTVFFLKHLEGAVDLASPPKIEVVAPLPPPPPPQP